jgi:IS5 family transposase
VFEGQGLQLLHRGPLWKLLCYCWIAKTPKGEEVAQCHMRLPKVSLLGRQGEPSFELSFLFVSADLLYREMVPNCSLAMFAAERVRYRRLLRLQVQLHRMCFWHTL